MKTRWLAALFALITGSPLYGQNARRDDVAFQTITQASSVGTVSFLKPISGATITIGSGNFSCSVTNNASGSSASCSPLAFLCSSSSDTVCNQPNPTNADVNGNYGFWLKPGRYQVAITGLGVSGRVVTYDLPVGTTDSNGLVSLSGFAGNFTVNFPTFPSGATAQSVFAGTSSTSGGIEAFQGVQGSSLADLFRADPIDGNVKATNFRICGLTGGFFNSTCPLTISSAGVFNAVVSPSITDSSLTVGNCVQAATGGTLTTVSGPCGTSSGTLTATGSPASGNLTKWSGATSLTNGDLSGDCTTSGALAITCTKTSGTAFAPSATTDTTNAANISTGNLSVNRLNGGAGASSSTFWRGDGTWAAPAVSGASSAAQTSAATNFGVNLGSQTVIASVPSNTGIFITVEPIESLLGVGCTVASNSVTAVISYTDVNQNSVATISAPFSESSSGALLPTVYNVNQASGVTFFLVAKAGTSVTYTTSSTLSSTGCSTTPQYTVYAKAIF